MPAPQFDAITQVQSLDGGLIQYFKPWRLPDDGFQICEDAVIFRGQLEKRAGYSLLGTLGPLISAESVGMSGSKTYSHTFSNLPVIPFTVSVTDGTSTLNDTGNGAFYQPAKSITSITAANPGVVTAASHGYSNGDQVAFFNTGMTQVNTPVSGYKPYTIANVTTNTFTIANTTGFTASGASGTVRKIAGAINYTTGVSTIVFAVNTVGSVTTNYQYAQGLPVMGLLTSEIDPSVPMSLIAFDTANAYTYSTTTQIFQSISGATTWTGNDAQFFCGLNYLNAFFATNGLDPIRYYISGTTWTDFKPYTDSSNTTLVSTCLLLLNFKNRMVMLNTTESAINYPQRARWSQNGTAFVTTPVPTNGSYDATAWQDDIVGHGGYFDAPTHESITGAAFYKDTLIVFFQNSTWELVYSGNELLPFFWRRINTQLGSQSTFSTVSFDEGILAVGTYGMTRNDSNNTKRIDLKIPDLLYNSNQSTPSRIYGVRDFANQLAYWTYLSTNNTSGYPDQVLCYNYLEDTWSIFNVAFTCFGHYELVTTVTWEQMTLPWSSYTQPWDTLTSIAPVPLVVAGTNNGQVMVFDGSTTDSGTNFGFDIWTKAFNPFHQEGHKGSLVYIDLFMTGTQNGAMTVNVYDDDNHSNILATFNVPTSSETSYFWERLYVNLNLNFITIEFTMNADQVADPLIGPSSFALLGFNLAWNRGGRFNQHQLANGSG